MRNDNRHMVHTMYVDNLSRPFNVNPAAGRGIAMQVAGHNSSGVQCNSCKGVGHTIQDCAVLNEKEYGRGRSQSGQQAQRNQVTPRHLTATPDDTRRGAEGNQRHSFQNNTTDSDAHYHIQHRQRDIRADYGSATMYLIVTPTTPSRLPLWKHRWRRDHSGN